MIIPNPPNSPITKTESVNEEWRSYFERLTHYLLVSATLIEASAATIAAFTPQQKKGFIYDTTNDKFYVVIAGVLREIPII